MGRRPTERTTRILLIGDDPDARRDLTRHLAKEFEVRSADSVPEALMQLRAGKADVALVELGPAETQVTDLVQGCAATVLLCDRDGTDAALSGLAAGAFAVLRRPFRLAHLVHTLRRAAEHARALGELAARRELDRRTISTQAVPEDMQELAEKAAGSDAPVLIEGTSGDVAERIARFIHVQGARSERPFAAVRVSTLDPEAMLSELFGHAAGAFEGAGEERVGSCVLVDGGTVFLSDVETLDGASQAALVRLIEHGEVVPVGATATRTVDVRLIASTTCDLAAEVDARAFRRDLFTALGVFRLVARPEAKASSKAGAGTLEEVESSRVAEVLDATGRNKSVAARELGVSRRKLYRLIEKHGL